MRLAVLVVLALAGCATNDHFSQTAKMVAHACHPTAHIIITADCQTKLCTPMEAVGGFWGGLKCRY